MESNTVLRQAILVNILRKTVLRNVTKDLHFAQMPVLRFIIAHPACTQSDISCALHVTPASIAQSTKRMEKSGLIYKVVDKDNGRKNNLYVTEEGENVNNKVCEKFDLVDKKMFEGFDEKDLNELSNFYDRIIFNLTGEKQEITPQKFMEFVEKLREIEMQGETNGKKRK